MNIKVKITREENTNYFNCSIGDIVEVEFEQYVAAVIASEIGNSNYNACCAQAIAARTYAINRGVLEGKSISDDSSVAQAYRASRNNYLNCIKAAQETKGIILVYNNKPISAVYSSCNGGRTTSCEERWGNFIPYLIAQNDPWDAATGKKKNGHGVGMSQVGAIWAGKSGITYKEILNFYYPKTMLCNNYGKKEEIKIKKIQLLEMREQLQQQLDKIKKKLEASFN